MRLGRSAATLGATAALVAAGAAVSTPAFANGDFTYTSDYTGVASPDETLTISGTGCASTDGNPTSVVWSVAADQESLSSGASQATGAFGSIIPNDDGTWTAAIDLPTATEAAGLSDQQRGVLGFACYNYDNKVVDSFNVSLALDSTKPDGSYTLTTTADGTQTIETTITGFTPEETIRFGVVPADSHGTGTSPTGDDFTELTTFTADADGGATGSFPVPADLPDGRYRVGVVGDSHGEYGYFQNLLVKDGTYSITSEDGSTTGTGSSDSSSSTDDASAAPTPTTDASSPTDASAAPSPSATDASAAPSPSATDASAAPTPTTDASSPTDASAAPSPSATATASLSGSYSLTAEEDGTQTITPDVSGFDSNEAVSFRVVPVDSYDSATSPRDASSTVLSTSSADTDGAYSTGFTAPASLPDGRYRAGVVGESSGRYGYFEHYLVKKEGTFSIETEDGTDITDISDGAETTTVEAPAAPTADDSTDSSTTGTSTGETSTGSSSPSTTASLSGSYSLTAVDEEGTQTITPDVSGFNASEGATFRVVPVDSYDSATSPRDASSTVLSTSSADTDGAYSTGFTAPASLPDGRYRAGVVGESSGRYGYFEHYLVKREGIFYIETEDGTDISGGAGAPAVETPATGGGPAAAAPAPAAADTKAPAASSKPSTPSKRELARTGTGLGLAVVAAGLLASGAVLVARRRA
ncbi:hypothetical protein [uncultured Actinomyces sp.]|uniref:hypothetical protein n=3 Tax=uncultured Actinomyces sp. TaxID=249061 RepID=UPI0028D3E04F|nr:hypothetical protein [uncultured Actinomyces sp.]